MRRRISTKFFFFFLLSVDVVAAGNVSATTCPYDLEEASHIITPACYANATAPSDSTSCCWFVLAAYIYAAARYANLTGSASKPTSTDCPAALSSFLLSRRLVTSDLLSGGNNCTIPSLSSSSDPCLLPTVSAIRAAANLTNATTLCTIPPSPSCTHCQNAVISSVFSLSDATGSSDITICGMATTIALWSSSPPLLLRFKNYALCMLQILENVAQLSLPSPPPSASFFSPSSSSGPSTAIIAGGVSGALISLAAAAAVAIAIHRRRKKNPTAVDEFSTVPEIQSEGGLYIFTEAELEVATNGFDETLLLGEGGAGRVYLGKLPSGQKVAIKRIQQEKKVSEFYKEVEILAKLRHRSLTTLVGYCLARHDHALVYEYMPGGNLENALHGDGGMTWWRRVRVAADVAEGLAYLHGLPDGAVVHRDVKPTNVLLGEDGRAKLSDFGVSRVVPAGVGHVSTEVKGTLGYVDPESFPAGHVSEAGDVYAFGVVLLELVTGWTAVVPSPSGGAESIIHVADRSATELGGPVVDPRLGDEWDPATVTAVFDLARRCVRPVRSDRPRMTEVLSELRTALAEPEKEGGGGETPELYLDSSWPVSATVEELSGDSSTAAMTTSSGSTPLVRPWSL